LRNQFKLHNLTAVGTFRLCERQYFCLSHRDRGLVQSMTSPREPRSLFSKPKDSLETHIHLCLSHGGTSEGPTVGLPPGTIPVTSRTKNVLKNVLSVWSTCAQADSVPIIRLFFKDSSLRPRANRVLHLRPFTPVSGNPLRLPAFYDAPHSPNLLSTSIYLRLFFESLSGLFLALRLPRLALVLPDLAPSGQVCWFAGREPPRGCDRG